MNAATPDRTTSENTNTVLLIGRVSSGPQARSMPSGDELVQFRVVVARPPRRGAPRTQVDAIDIACWSARSRTSAQRLQEDDIVEIEGSLRRRFFAGASGRVSRYEVEARRVRRRHRSPP